MKPAILRPQARHDRQVEVRHYRKKAGSQVATQLVVATNAALDRIELEPGIGSPVFGQALDIPDLQSWRVTGFPLLCFYFERHDHLDVVRLLGERQDIVAILTGAL